MRAPMPSTTKRVCIEEESGLRRGPWTLEEDTLLTHNISLHGEGRWNILAKCSGLKRTGKSCRLRWLNYLKPDIKRGNLTPQEQLLILELHSKWGNRWSKIAQHLPGRTDNEIKNYWRTRVQKQARQLNIESNSKMFLDAVRCFWMPRLVQKVEQTSFSSASSSTVLNSQTDLFSSLPTNSTISSLQAVCPPPSTVAKYSKLGSDNSCFISSPGVFSANSSITISKQPEILENSTSHPPVLGADTFYKNPVLPSDTYHMGMVGDCSYYMDGLHMASVCEIGNFASSPMEYQVAEGSWLSDGMSDSLWNMDDMWQHRELGGWSSNVAPLLFG